ncbi:hypothetical protein HFQ57_08335 [Salmonella enterica subsp. enterica serovar Havana]|nr:hypothetical protein HFQ57_08335 [Salmonella enterica subsp. enterica serovar Havana]
MPSIDRIYSMYCYFRFSMVTVAFQMKFIVMVIVSARHERFRCRSCRRVFQLSYTCEARTLGVKYHIVDMAFNGADVRDTAKTLKIGINTVICTS